jgi:hypothetical protein
MELVKVDFKSSQIEVVEQTQSVVVKDICEAIGVSSKSQISKLQSDDSYESKLIKVQTKGGMQEVFTIPLSKLNGWLFSINPNKVKPEVKQKLIEYKKECFDVLNNYFNKGIAVNTNSKYYEDTIKTLADNIQKLLEENAKLQEQKNTITDKSCEEKLRIAERIAAQDAVLRPWSCEEIRVIIIGLQHVKDPSWLPHHLKKMKGETYEPNHTTQQRLKTLIEENKKLKRFYNEIKQLEI